MKEPIGQSTNNKDTNKYLTIKDVKQYKDEKYKEDNILENKKDVVLVEGGKELVFGDDWKGGKQNPNMNYASYKSHTPVEENKETEKGQKKESNEVTIEFPDTFKGTISQKEFSDISGMRATSNNNDNLVSSLTHRNPSMISGENLLKEKKNKSVIEEKSIIKKKSESGLFGMISNKIFGSEKKKEILSNKLSSDSPKESPLKNPIIKKDGKKLINSNSTKKYNQNEFIPLKNDYAKIYPNDVKMRTESMNIRPNDYSVNQVMDPIKPQDEQVQRDKSQTDIYSKDSNTNKSNKEKIDKIQLDIIKQPNILSINNITKEDNYGIISEESNQHKEIKKSVNKPKLNPVKKKNNFGNWGKFTKNKLKDELKK